MSFFFFFPEDVHVIWNEKWKHLIYQDKVNDIEKSAAAMSVHFLSYEF